MLDLMGFKKEFISQCRSALGEYGPENMTIEETKVSKPRRGSLTGMVFVAQELPCAPTLYVEDFYNEYRSGGDIKDLSRAAVETVVNSLGMANLLAGKTEELLKDPKSLGVRLLNKSCDKEYMEGLATMDTDCGFAYIADIEFGEYRLVIRKEMLESMGMDNETLFHTALQNTMKKFPAVLYDLKDSVLLPHKDCVNLLKSRSKRAPAGAGPGFVLTNSRLYWGAGALFYPGVIERIHELLDNDFYVLPSSVHELIITPVEYQDPEMLAEMIRSANRSVVEPGEILADDLFICESGVLRRLTYGGELPYDPDSVC